MRSPRPARVMALLAVLVLAAAMPAAGQEGYHLGAVSTSAGVAADADATGYSLTASIGQPDATEAVSDEYSFVGGILPEAGFDTSNSAFSLFIPVVTR